MLDRNSIFFTLWGKDHSRSYPSNDTYVQSRVALVNSGRASCDPNTHRAIGRPSNHVGIHLRNQESASQLVVYWDAEQLYLPTDREWARVVSASSHVFTTEICHVPDLHRFRSVWSKPESGGI